MLELPAEFVSNMKTLLGEEQFSIFHEALSSPRPTTIRINGKKITYQGENPVQWCPQGCYLDQRFNFTFDPLFHSGAYYVQEASSMFLGYIISRLVSEPVVALDLCAAPGGKSTHLVSALPENSLLVSNEVMRSRLPILVENLTKWGSSNVVVTNSDPSQFTELESFFDLIVTDVPCSGEGMFRKDPVAVSEWSPANVDICYQRQRRILRDIWQSLKPGGLLVYSTCTYNLLEDEENISWICSELGADPVAVDYPAEWGITSSLSSDKDLPVYRFLPHKTQGEGFFIAVVRKHGEDSALSYRFPSSRRNKSARTAQPVPKEVYDWLSSPSQFAFTCENDSITAVPFQYAEHISLLKSKLKCCKAGLALARIKGRDIIPEHSLAMSVDCNKEKFTQIELDYEQAIAYLRKDAVALPTEAPRGYLLMTYKNVPLGFVKNIGNRSNNLYPQEWRILTTHRPENLKILEL